MRSAIILALFLMLVSCAKKPAEEVDDAIDQAQTYLSADKCDDAIEVLEEVGRQTSNPVYLAVLSSAYACRASYSTTRFLDEDIDAIDTTSTLLFPSLSILPLSTETVADSADYENMLEGLNIILHVDSDQPSQTAREAKYGPSKAGDLGVQILFMGLTQLGKFLHHYGDVGADGTKGGGSGSNICFAEYTYAAANTYLDTANKTCKSVGPGDGHPDLSFSDLPLARRRMCEGLMLVTNILDILENMTLPSNEAVAALDDVATVVSGFKTAVTTVDPALATLMSTTSQSVCEELVTSDANEWNNLQYIYAILFETGLNDGVPP